MKSADEISTEPWLKLALLPSLHGLCPPQPFAGFGVGSARKKWVRSEYSRWNPILLRTFHLYAFSRVEQSRFAYDIISFLNSWVRQMARLEPSSWSVIQALPLVWPSIYHEMVMASSESEPTASILRVVVWRGIKIYLWSCSRCKANNCARPRLICVAKFYRYEIKYPQMYAEQSDPNCIAFNCYQRAHQVSSIY